jgi:hypothetical protein
VQAEPAGPPERDNTGERRYAEDLMLPTTDFPSDHAVVSAAVRLRTAPAAPGCAGDCETETWPAGPSTAGSGPPGRPASLPGPLLGDDSEASVVGAGPCCVDAAESDGGGGGSSSGGGSGGGCGGGGGGGVVEGVWAGEAGWDEDLTLYDYWGIVGRSVQVDP